MSTSEQMVSVCGFPCSTIWKSSFVRLRTKLPSRVGDDGVDLDVVDLDLEGDRGLRLIGGAAPEPTAAQVVAAAERSDSTR